MPDPRSLCFSFYALIITDKLLTIFPQCSLRNPRSFCLSSDRTQGFLAGVSGRILVGQARKVVERTFRLLEKVPVVRWDELMGIRVYEDRYTLINSPMIHNDPMYDEARSRRHRCATFVRGNKDLLYDLSYMRPSSAGESGWHS